ncbi:MAG TPA: HD domain-containing phosphohydrolase [Alphaproteobacteria bacterium]|nr:HD domain-containing phosphohydrolase [Alphaproteobacteria bacterium]
MANAAASVPAGGVETPDAAPSSNLGPSNLGSSAPDTAPPRRRRHRRLSFQLVAALWIGVLLCVISAALTYQAYRGAQDQIRATAAESARYIGESLSEKVSRVLRPAESALNLLANSSLTEAGDIGMRLRALPDFLRLLTSDAGFDAAFIGYVNGEFLLIRPLRGAGDQERYAAPRSAALLVQSISRDETTGASKGEYRFYAADGTLLRARAEPDYVFDPRTRPWYEAAHAANRTILTDPYIYFTTRALGVTMARPVRDGGPVIGIDLKLQSIAAELAPLRITPATEIAVIDRFGRVIGYPDPARLVITNPDSSSRLAGIQDLGVPALAEAARIPEAGASATATRSGGVRQAEARIDGRGWQLLRTDIRGLEEQSSDGQSLAVLIAVPDDELFAGARALLGRQLLIAGLILMAALSFGVWASGLLARPLQQLARRTRAVAAFDFTGDMKVPTRIAEIGRLAAALGSMQGTIRQFLDIGQALSSEGDLHRLLERVLRETVRLVEGEGGAIYLLAQDGATLEPELALWDGGNLAAHGAGPEPIGLGGAGLPREIDAALRQGEIVMLGRPVDGAGLQALGLAGVAARLGAAQVGLMVVPLVDRQRRPLGVLLLLRRMAGGDVVRPIGARQREFIRAVSGSAGIAIENKLLLKAQKDLMNALIRLIAGAIDAKSPYTGGHCQRVPVLTRMLAEAACADASGPFRDFALSEQEWEAVDIGSWLHDCGKVTTPEYVVDKATKLECIYDRIHEIRMRFELLKGAAETAYWRGLAEGGDAAALRARRDAELSQLDDDFAFVAACNEGGEFMDPAKVERLKGIAARRWTRTLDDRLGCSYEERARKDRAPAPALPVEEPLLADRDDHLVPRAASEIIGKENPWGIRVETPANKFNRGELYNLSIGRGTLTAEERYIINDHMTQTIMMLEALPLPRHLAAVPEIAGGHHEKMNGTGYPKRLTRAQMSPVARMMAIADVFEALTAGDRPYKRAKTLSESFRILAAMKREHHLDPDLLDLFVTAGVWKDYAHRYLDAAQIDEPDTAALLAARPA